MAPVLPIVQPNTGDHDLLTKLDTKVDQIQLDVNTLKNLGNNYVTQLQYKEVVDIAGDHETRVRFLERNTWKLIGAATAIASIASIAISIVLRLYLRWN